MAVSRFLATIFLLLFQTRNKMTLGHREKDFFTDCPPSKCGKGGPEIRYPFRRESSPPNCGARDLVLSCSGNDTLLSLPESGSLKVIAIDYQYSEITIKLGKPWSDCQVQNFSSTSLTTPVYEPRDIFSLVNCSKEWNRGSAISCLSSVDHYVYMADIRMPVVLLPSDCVMVSTNLVMGTGVEREEVMLSWHLPEIGYTCEDCEWEGGRCMFNRAINQASCEYPGEYSFCGNYLLGKLEAVLLTVVRANVMPGRASYAHQAINNHTRVALATSELNLFQLLVFLVQSVYTLSYLDAGIIISMGIFHVHLP